MHRVHRAIKQLQVLAAWHSPTRQCGASAGLFGRVHFPLQSPGDTQGFVSTAAWFGIATRANDPAADHEPKTERYQTQPELTGYALTDSCAKWDLLVMFRRPDSPTCGVPVTGRRPESGAQGFVHGLVAVGEGFGHLFDPSREPVEHGLGCNGPEDAGAGARQVEIADPLASGGEHHGQVRDEFARTMTHSSGYELGEPVPGQGSEIHGVQQVAQGAEPGVGDQVLAGEFNTRSGVGQVRMVRRKGDPSNGYFRASTAPIFPFQITFRY